MHYGNNGIPILDKRTSAWIESASAEIREKLAKAGLIDMTHSHTLKELWDAFLEHKKLEQQTGQIKEETVRQYKMAGDRFFETFKESALLTDISKEMLVKWKTEFLKWRSQATVVAQL